MNRKTTLILVSVFILLGVYTAWFQSSKNSAALATPTPAAKLLVWNTTVDQITGFQITEPATGRKVAVSQDGQGQWQVTAPDVAPEARPGDAVQIVPLASGLAALAFTANLTTTTDLAPFGLITPTYQLDVKLVNGTTLTAAIGDKIPTGNGYYLLRNGDKTPLAVADTSVQPLIDLLDNPPYFVPTPTPAPSPDVLASPTALSP